MRSRYLLIGSLLMLSALLAACASQATPLPGIASPAGTMGSSTEAAGMATEGVGIATEAVGLATEAQGIAPAPDVQSVTVSDYNSLLSALQASGMTVEAGEPVQQPFFTVPGQILRVNGQDVQVFVYGTPQAMETDAAQVSADGSSIGGSMPGWIDAPHFYKAGPMLVLYVGQDQKIMDILSGFFGAQFAGQ